jgi:hypothetical protein
MDIVQFQMRRIENECASLYEGTHYAPVERNKENEDNWN